MLQLDRHVPSPGVPEFNRRFGWAVGFSVVARAQTALAGSAGPTVPHRTYLSGKVAAHVLGFMNQITDAEPDARRGDDYEEGDYIGRYGIERQMENWLRGKRGVERFVVDA